MKISVQAKRHAALLAASRRKGRVRPRGKLRGEELGDGISDIPIIGPLLSGLFGGGGSSANASGPAPGVSGSPSPGPSLGDIRNVVNDALSIFGGMGARDAASAARQTATSQAAVNSIFGALDPTLRQAKGGTQVQRLQSQATSEHNTLARREAATRLQTQRYTDTQAKLDRIATTVAAIQRRIGGTAAIVTDPTTKAILNVHG